MAIIEVKCKRAVVGENGRKIKSFIRGDIYYAERGVDADAWIVQGSDGEWKTFHNIHKHFEYC